MMLARLRNILLKSILFTVLLFFVGFLMAQQRVEGEIASYYDYSKDFSIGSSDQDVIIQRVRLKKDSRLDSIIYVSDNKTESSILIKNRLLQNEKGDSLAFYKNRKIYFSNSDVVIEEVKLKKNFFKNEGWAYVIENDTIAELKYKLTDDRLYYQLFATYDSDNPYAHLALQMCLGRIDKKVEMDYGTDVSSFGYIGAIIALCIL